MRGRAAVCVVLGLAWVAASHLLMTRASHIAWNGVVIVGPMLAWLAWLAARRSRWLLAAPPAVALAGLAGAAMRGGGLPLETLYVAQHATVHVALAVLFAQSLGAGREPLITALARRVHDGALTAAMERYSRGVTVVWAAYFAVMAALSAVLYALAPFAAWATFANIGTPLAMVTLFVGEHVVRYRLHPEFERATLGDAVRAWRRRLPDDRTA